MVKTTINLGDTKIGNNQPIILIGGLNVIENINLTFKTAKHIKNVCEKLNINFVFKASYDKANRSSVNSFRGLGIEKGLEILEEIKKELKIHIITDVHSPAEAEKACEICDIIQLPAFLARQTDLIEAMAKTKKAINIKKPQFISPNQVRNIIDKFLHYGNNNLMLCERGSNFGYDNLIVDFLGFDVMKKSCSDIPLIFDVTHSLQYREINSRESGGRREQIVNLALAGASTKIAGIFIETHPEPDKALCDGPSAIPLEKLEDLLMQIKELDKLVKSFPKINIS